MRSLLFFLMMLLAAPLTASAGGPFYSTLYDNHCTSLSGIKRRGCDGYLQYRIQHGKSRDETKNRCEWSCGEVFSSPTDVENCQAGCRDANSKDY